MIKKLNIFLFVVIGTMLILKVALDVVQSSGSVASSERPSADSVLNAEFSPRIIYEPLVTLAVENPLTRRKGYMLDVLSAIFPNARFEERKLNPDLVRKILMEDPTAVTVVYGDHPGLRDFPRAETSLATEEIVLYTLRELEWNYTGPESLAKIRIGISEGYEDCPNLMRYCESSKTNAHPMRIFSPSEKYYLDPLGAVVDGVVDAVALANTDYSSLPEVLGITGGTIVSFNISPTIDRVPLRFIVSNADPEYAKRMIEAYENGLKEIESSGRLRRIREYYRISKD